jgi:mono/diheme cytochrome c family protein
MQVLDIRRNHLLVNSLIALVFTVLSLTACSPAGLGSSSSSDEIALISEGETIYQANCANCHGINGEGEPNWKTPKEDGTYPAPPHTVDGHTWHHGDNLLFQIVEGGGDSLDIPNFKSNMPAFGGVLTDEEIIAVLTYLKSIWPAEQQRFQFEASQRELLPDQ